MGEKWQFEYEEQCRQMKMMGGAMNRMKNVKMSQAWEKWQFEYEEFNRQLKMMTGAMNRMKNLHLSRAWNQWRSILVYATEEETIYNWPVRPVMVPCLGTGSSVLIPSLMYPGLS